MPCFSHRGRRLGYLDTGAPESAPPGRTDNLLVLLHAFPLNARMWEPQLAAAPPGWRLLAPDFRGFGATEDDAGRLPGATTDGGAGAPTEPSIDDYVDDVLSLLDELGIERAAFAGLSMGGYVALGLLRQAAPRVAGLVLADTKAEADSEQARNGRVEMQRVLDGGGITAVVDRMVPRLLGERTRRERPAIEQAVRALSTASTPLGVRAALTRMMTRPDSTSWLGSIRCPVLVIAGEDDVVTPPDVAGQMQQRIPGARLARIAGAGHLSNLEQPDAFNAALNAFLAAAR